MLMRSSAWGQPGMPQYLCVAVFDVLVGGAVATAKVGQGSGPLRGWQVRASEGFWRTEWDGERVSGEWESQITLI